MSFALRSRLFLLSLAMAGTLLYGTRGQAAEQVVLKYGILRQSIPVADLTAFAETGDRALIEGYNISDSDAQQVRTTLTQQVKIDVRWLDRGLNNPVGDALLDQVGEAIQTPTGDANRQALRSALVLAASDDNKLSLLEVIQKYPTREVHVDGKRLANAYSQIAKFETQVRKVLSVIDLF